MANWRSSHKKIEALLFLWARRADFLDARGYPLNPLARKQLFVSMNGDSVPAPIAEDPDEDKLDLAMDRMHQCRREHYNIINAKFRKIVDGHRYRTLGVTGLCRVLKISRDEWYARLNSAYDWLDGHLDD